MGCCRHWGDAVSLSFMHSVGLRQPLHFPDLPAIREGQKCFRWWQGELQYCFVSELLSCLSFILPCSIDIFSSVIAWISHFDCLFPEAKIQTLPSCPCSPPSLPGISLFLHKSVPTIAAPSSYSFMSTSMPLTQSLHHWMSIMTFFWHSSSFTFFLLLLSLKNSLVSFPFLPTAVTFYIYLYINYIFCSLSVTPVSMNCLFAIPRNTIFFPVPYMKPVITTENWQSAIPENPTNHKVGRFKQSIIARVFKIFIELFIMKMESWGLGVAKAR